VCECVCVCVYVCVCCRHSVRVLFTMLRGNVDQGQTDYSNVDNETVYSAAHEVCLCVLHCDKQTRRWYRDTSVANTAHENSGVKSFTQ